MPNDIEKISGEIARSTSFDGYSLWRMLKDVNNQIFALERERAPVPIELARLRAIISRAQELRQTRDRSSDTFARQPETVARPSAGSFDEFDFVDHYRSLGGVRVAVDMGGAAVEIRQWNDDTPEAADFWKRSWSGLGPKRRSAVACALLIRGRY